MFAQVAEKWVRYTNDYTSFRWVLVYQVDVVLVMNMKVRAEVACQGNLRLVSTPLVAHFAKGSPVVENLLATI